MGWRAGTLGVCLSPRFVDRTPPIHGAASVTSGGGPGVNRVIEAFSQPLPVASIQLFAGPLRPLMVVGLFPRDLHALWNRAGATQAHAGCLQTRYDR